jgi:hypothetical protein
MIDIIREEMEEEAERHDESDARQRGAEVVPIARRFISGLDDP